MNQYTTEELIIELVQRGAERITVEPYHNQKVLITEKYKNNPEVRVIKDVLILNFNNEGESMKITVKSAKGLTKRQQNWLEQAVRSKTPILIKGRSGPHGKTTLKKDLLAKGANVFEEYECMVINFYD